MEKKEFVIKDITPGKLNALVRKIMEQTGTTDPIEAVRLINSGEYIITKLEKKWREENGIIYFTVTSDGTTGAEWIARLKPGEYAKDLLLSKKFKPTSEITTEIAVLKGTIAPDNGSVARMIREKVSELELEIPNAEIGCLISEKFTSQEIRAMGLESIVTMHEPIEYSPSGAPFVLVSGYAFEPQYKYQYLNAASARSMENGCHREFGFAYVVSQVKS